MERGVKTLLPPPRNSNEGEIMESRLKTVFSEDWYQVKEMYMQFLVDSGTDTIKEELLLYLLEVGVKFGERLSQIHSGGFVEIGCGLGIPSLTLARLGNDRGRAIDIHPAALLFAQKLRDLLDCRLRIEQRDVFKERPILHKDDLLIAEKPASYKKNALEVEYNIANWCKIEGHKLAMIPSFLPTDSITSYSDRCESYSKRLRQVGFQVDNQQIHEPLPYRWIIALK